MNSWATEFQHIFSGKRIVVTGASGFIGSHLCDALVESGAKVYSFDRIVFQESLYLKYQSRQVDLTNWVQVKTELAEIRPDIIYHLAAIVTAKQDMNLVLPMLQNNLVGTVNLLLSASETGCDRVVLIGSAEETDDSHPGSPYAASKSAANLYAKLFTHVYGLPIVVLRLFMVYGPRQNEEKLIPYSILSLLQNKVPTLSSPEREVDFIYIRDVIRGLLMAGSHPNLENNVIELGTGDAFKIKDVINLISQLLEVNGGPVIISEHNRFEEKNLIVNSDSARTVLGWQPQWSLKDGLVETISWYRQKMEKHGES